MVLAYDDTIKAGLRSICADLLLMILSLQCGQSVGGTQIPLKKADEDDGHGPNDHCRDDFTEYIVSY